MTNASLLLDQAENALDEAEEATDTAERRLLMLLFETYMAKAKAEILGLEDDDDERIDG